MKSPSLFLFLGGGWYRSFQTISLQNGARTDSEAPRPWKDSLLITPRGGEAGETGEAPSGALVLHKRKVRENHQVRGQLKAPHPTGQR